ncbi:MAG: hypothetical protein IPJ88_15630 [Myxococcales bacterium]|nr:MAG: hypothetical protein IPJ88_15630 [Myxococcales bacterium]
MSEKNHAFVIQQDGEDVERVEVADDLTARLEALVYLQLASSSKDLMLLHAASVVRSKNAVVLMGPSGAGKSTLSLLSVQAGFRYLSDEFIWSDGHSLWGLPRSIQFDLRVDEPSKRPALFNSNRFVDRRMKDVHGQLATSPIYPLLDCEVATMPVLPTQVHWVVIEQSKHTKLSPMKPLEMLAVIHEHAFIRPKCDIGQLIDVQHCSRLHWENPEHAVALIKDWGK